jgi:hypothetical protein
MIVIGADTHKRSHAQAAVEAGTGRVRGRREIKADEPGQLAAARWARGLDEQRVRLPFAVAGTGSSKLLPRATISQTNRRGRSRARKPG